MKISLKRKSHLTKLAEMRKSKKIFKKKTIAIEVQKPKESRVVRQFRQLLLRRRMRFICGHYLVGASSMLRLWNGNYDLRRAHGSIRSQLNHGIGSVGEQAFAAEPGNYVHHPFAISRRLPFLCATTDYIIFKREPELIEIKTSTSAENCENILKKPPHEYLIQVWTAMEIFGLKKARLLIYHYEKGKGGRNNYGYKNWVSLYGAINITNNYDIFQGKLAIKLINRYIDFLRVFYAELKVKTNDKDLADIKQLLVRCAETHKRLFTTNSCIRQLFVERKSKNISSICKLLAGCDPQDERYGLRSRQQYEQNRFKNVTQNLKIRQIQRKRSKVRERSLSLNKNMFELIFNGEENMFNELVDI